MAREKKEREGRVVVSAVNTKAGNPETGGQSSRGRLQLSWKENGGGNAEEADPHSQHF